MLLFYQRYIHIACNQKLRDNFIYLILIYIFSYISYFTISIQFLSSSVLNFCLNSQNLILNKDYKLEAPILQHQKQCYIIDLLHFHLFLAHHSLNSELLIQLTLQLQYYPFPFDISIYQPGLLVNTVIFPITLILSNIWLSVLLYLQSPSLCLYIFYWDIFIGMQFSVAGNIGCKESMVFLELALANQSQHICCSLFLCSFSSVSLLVLFYIDFTHLRDLWLTSSVNLQTVLTQHHEELSTFEGNVSLNRWIQYLVDWSRCHINYFFPVSINLILNLTSFK